MQDTALSAGYSSLCWVPAMLLPDDSRSGVLLRIASELLCTFNTRVLFLFQGAVGGAAPATRSTLILGLPAILLFCGWSETAVQLPQGCSCGNADDDIRKYLLSHDKLITGEISSPV